MYKVRDLVNSPKFAPPVPHPEILDDTYIGIEVETEGSGVRPYDADEALQYWRCTEDGSLKSNSPWEFIFVSPMAGGQVVTALEELDEYLSGTPVKYPLNTGVHVHINVGDLNTKELRRFVYLLLVTESALLKYSGGKFNNNFCLPWKNVSMHMMQAFGQFLEVSHSMPDMMEGMKYATINVASIFKLGTVEVRTLTGTHSKDVILDWVNVLLRLKEFAVTRLKGDDVLDYATSKRSVIEFLKIIWDDATVRKMLHKELHKDMLSASLMARVILFPKNGKEFRKGFTDTQDTAASDIMDMINNLAEAEYTQGE